MLWVLKWIHVRQVMFMNLKYCCPLFLPFISEYRLNYPHKWFRKWKLTHATANWVENQQTLMNRLLPQQKNIHLSKKGRWCWPGCGRNKYRYSIHEQRSLFTFYKVIVTKNSNNRKVYVSSLFFFIKIEL